jgi:membrane-associated phospholipid phosphatase
MRTTILLLTALILGAPVGLPAQGGSGEPLFSTRDAWIAGGFVAGTLALAPLDRQVAEALQDSLRQRNRAYQYGATTFRLIGFPGSVIIGGSLYAVGRLSGNERMADLGLHGAEAILLGSALNITIKTLAGRARPYDDVANPYNFQLGRGFLNDHYQSFPSGHTLAAFAAAAAVTSETGRWWPDAKPWIGTALYGGAALVGASRMYNNFHWTSDVIIGAGIGSFAGWKVVQYAHDNPDNQVDQWLLGVTLVPGGAGWVARLWMVPVF